MGKPSKAHLFREKMMIAANQGKQVTLDKLHNLPEKESNKSRERPAKSILIIGIDTITKEDELDLHIEFRLLPSSAAFSKVYADLLFNEQKINTVCLSIRPSFLAKNDFEFTQTLSMKGVGAGSYLIKVEMYELWSLEEKLNLVSKEVSVDYIPQTRESKWVKIPTVKSVAGNDLTVVDDSEKAVYREIDEALRKEEESKRDDW